MATTVKRLILVRRKDVNASLLEEGGFIRFLKGKPIPITTLVWDESQGLSHYAYVLDGLKLKDLETLDKWQSKLTGVTILPYRKQSDENGKSTKIEETTEETLARVGLRVNKLALEEDEPQTTKDN